MFIYPIQHFPAKFTISSKFAVRLYYPPPLNSIPIFSRFGEIQERRYCDTVVNSHDSKIIYLCHAFDLKILNGRTIGDDIGSFTHLNACGVSSTIDYGICNYNMYNIVDHFLILPLNELSDHFKIAINLKSHIEIPKNTNNWKSNI